MITNTKNQDRTIFKIRINQWFGDELVGQIILCEDFYSLSKAVNMGQILRGDIRQRRYSDPQVSSSIQ